MRIVHNSFWTREWTQRTLGYDFTRQMRVVPGGIDVDLFPAQMDTSGLDKKYKLSGRKVVLFSGKLTKYKGVKYLIQAARKINGLVLIVGDGPDRVNLELLVKNLKSENVRFLGFIGNHDLIKLYYRADVCVVPSVWDEPLGLVVF